MGAPELGLKYTCINCQQRFYDLLRSPAVCPKCETEQPKPKPRVFAPGRSARNWSSPSSRQVIPATAADEVTPEAEVEEELLDEDDEIEAVIPDDDDAEDNDDVPKPILEE